MKIHGEVKWKLEKNGKTPDIINIQGLQAENNPSVYTWIRDIMLRPSYFGVKNWESK